MADIALPYFLSLPAAPAPWPGVVVIHEGGGMSPQLLRVCQRLAGAGYAAIAPDLFFRAGGSEAADYSVLMGSMERGQTLRDISDAAATLRGLGATKVGVTGFCLGGSLTYRTAVNADGFDAAVSFYGAGIHRELGDPKCPALLFFGGKDQYITPEEIAQVAAHHPETIVYPEADHGFFRDRSPSYDEAAAADAWRRLTAFFGEHLR